MWRFLIFVVPTFAMAQVEQGAPNADFAPAFEGQTRAPMLPSTDVSVSVFSEGFEFPWGIAPLPDGRFLVTERGGAIVLIGADGARLAEVGNTPQVAAINQGGMLDVAVSDNFATDGVVYWTYAKPVGNGAALAAGRGVLVGTDLTQVEDIFVQTPAVRGGRHFGSRIVIGNGGVWITAGDRGAESYVQDPQSTIGKVIWIPHQGTPEVWSTGHRNIQGAILRGGLLWTMEHGPRGGDELNQPQQGLNYGWPLISYGINYNGADIGDGIAVAAGLEQPVYYWDPVIAPGGMGTYPMDGAFAPWRGDLLVSSLFPGGLMRLKLQDGRVIGEERLLADVGRVRDVEVLANGDLLVLLDTPNAAILRVTPNR